MFRRLCDELAPAHGLPDEKFTARPRMYPVHAHGTVGKRFLFFRASPRSLFPFDAQKSPSAKRHRRSIIMRLRNSLRIADHRRCPTGWGAAYLHVNADVECRLTLDLREAPSLLTRRLSSKPGMARSRALGRSSEGDGWRNWPVITPPCAVYPPLLLARRMGRPAPSTWRPEEIFLYERTRRRARKLPHGPAARTTPRRRRHAAWQLVVEDAIRRAQQPGKSCARHRGPGPKRQTPSGRGQTACAGKPACWRAKTLSDMAARCRPPAQHRSYRFSAEKTRSVTPDGGSAGGPVDLPLDPRLTVRGKHGVASPLQPASAAPFHA